MTRPRAFRVGEWIKFRSPTRSHDRAAVRKIVNVDVQGCPQVRYHGWSNFIVLPHEVIARGATRADAAQ